MSPSLVYILMLDLDREVMNKFYKSKYSDADEVTKVGFFCQGNVYMNKSHSSYLLNIVLISMYVFSSTVKWKGKNMYIKGKNAPVWFVVRILWILFYSISLSPRRQASVSFFLGQWLMLLCLNPVGIQPMGFWM